MLKPKALTKFARRHVEVNLDWFLTGQHGLLKMKTVIQSSEAKARFSELLGRLKQGEEFTITHYKQPVAKLTPLRPSPNQSEIAALFARIDSVRRKTVLNPSGKVRVTLKEAVEEGRR